jgi:hypothetical protein
VKDFSEFRTDLNEHVDIPSHGMPPNLLILRRKTVRQFPNNVMVALYYNEKLKQYFSIPYGGVEPDESVITPVSLKEAEELMEGSSFGAKKRYQDWAGEFENHVIDINPAHAGKIEWDSARYLHSQGHRPEVAAKKYTDSNPYPWTSHFHREEAEQIDELSQSTLKRYIVGAAKSKDSLAAKTKNLETHAIKSRKRTVGIRHAVEKLHEDHKIGDEVHYGISSSGAFKRGVVVKVGDDHVIVKRGRYPYKVKKTSIVSPSEKKDLSEATGHTNAIDELRKIRDTHSMEHVHHDDGTKTRVDHVTAHMLLTVHDNINPENQAKFAGALKKSKPMFHKMVDFGWKQVK